MATFSKNGSTGTEKSNAAKSAKDQAKLLIDLYNKNHPRLSARERHFCTMLPKLFARLNKFHSKVSHTGVATMHMKGLTFACNHEHIPSAQDEKYHIYVSKEELKMIPLIRHLPFVTVTSFNPGDIIVAKGKKLLRLYERKTTTDLGNLVRYRDQRARLTKLPVNRSDITIILERSAKEKRVDHALQLSCESNAVWREGFSWRKTSSLLHTICLLLRDFVSTIEYGPSPERAQSVVIPSAPVFSQDDVVGGTPAAYCAHSPTLFAKQLCCITGVSKAMGVSIASTWGSWSSLLSDTDKLFTTLRDLQYTPANSRKNKQRKIGPTVASRICQSAGVDCEQAVIFKRKKRKQNPMKT